MGENLTYVQSGECAPRQIDNFIDKVWNENCLDVMRRMPDNSVDAIVTDPPYGWAMMGKKWDYDVPSIEIWKEVLRVLKPGGHALVACGTRTQHRMVTNIEDAGFEVRDIIVWVYGSGFPKSLNISKAIDKELGCKRGVVGDKLLWGHNTGTGAGSFWIEPVTDPSSDLAKQYDRYGTSLKPSVELFTLVRKPISEKTIAKNVIKWQTGGINIDACRIGTEQTKTCMKDLSEAHGNQFGKPGIKTPTVNVKDNPPGRWPANLIHDGSDEVLALFPSSKSGVAVQRNRDGQVHNTIYGPYKKPPSEDVGYGDSGSAARFFCNVKDKMTPNDVTRENAMLFSKEKHQFNYGDNGSPARFFYCPKASKSEKNAGLDSLDKTSAPKTGAGKRLTTGGSKDVALPRANTHPTVKPLALMRYLCRLITPLNGIILDPFAGSGTTGVAAALEGFRFIGCELEEEYCEIARLRIEHHKKPTFELCG